MSKRVNQHQIEDISRAKFQLALPRKWVFRDKDKDYGIDGEVELFDNDQKAQGLVFWVQLKATESTEISKILNVDFRIETLEYYKSLDIPVLLVRYADSSNSIYYKWLNNIDLFNAKENAKTFRVKLTEQDLFTEDSSNQIESYLKIVRNLKSGHFSFPLPVSIHINDGKINSISKGILLTKLKGEIKNYEDFVILTPRNNSAIQIEIDAQKLKVNASELTGCYFHSMDLRPSENFSTDLIHDALLGIAVSLIKLGHSEEGCRIIIETNLKNRLIKNPILLEFFLIPLFNSSYFKEVLNLIDEIINNDSEPLINIKSQISILFASETNSENKKELIELFLKKRIKQAEEKNDNGPLGTTHYNIGNHYNGRGKFLKAIHHYNLARKFAPIYLNQHYYFAEIGSILFRNGKFTIASKMYSKSLEIKPDNKTIGLLADSMMLQGQYKKAFETFEKYLDGVEKPSPEFFLKYISLESILRIYNTESQIRNEERGRTLADITKINKEKDQVEQIEKAFEFDLLSDLAWFNLGHINLENEKFSNASFCFTMSALIFNEDIESWINATVLGFQSGENIELVVLIIKAAYFFNREHYLEALYNHLEQVNPAAPIDKLIEMVELVIHEESQETPTPMPSVRILNEKGIFENINN